MKLKNLLILFLIFLPFAFSASLTNYITEPAQPLTINTDFNLSVLSVADANEYGANYLLTNYSFETVTDQNSDMIKFANWKMMCKVGKTYCNYVITNYGVPPNCFNSSNETMANASQSTAWKTQGSYSFATSGDAPATDVTGTNLCIGAYKINSIGGTGTTNITSNSVTKVVSITTEGQLLNQCADINITSDYNKVIIGLSGMNGANAVWIGGTSILALSEQELTQYIGQTIRVCVDLNTWDYAAIGANDWGGYIDNVTIKVLGTISYDINAYCKSSFANSPFSSMAFHTDTNINSITYTTPLTSGDFNYAIDCHATTLSDGNITDYDEGIISVTRREFEFLTFTPIENIGSWNFGSIIINPTNEANTIIFKVDSNSGFAEDVNFIINNSLDDGRQYFIYTSADGITYSFDDTLTYGGLQPTQKIWDNANNRYIYSFVDTLTPVETKYYKLTYKMPAKYWKNVNANWFQQMQPAVSEIAGQNTDIYNLSTFSNIRNYLIQNIPQIDQAGYKNYSFQFTAWASATTSLKIGLIKNGNISNITNLSTISITTDKKRYSANVYATDFDSQLILYTNETTGKQLYILDYALIPRGYFTKRIELKDAANEQLPILVWGTNYFEYIKEGKQFRANSQIYDREGDLNSAIVEVYLDSVNDVNKVKYYSFNISSTAETTTALSYLINQVVDLNGATNTQRMLKVKITLYDTNNSAISTQSKWIKFIQFPYFKEDFSIYATETYQKIGNNPTGSIFVNTIAPENFLGVKIKIWNDTNSYSDPNYTKIIYSDSFSCQMGECAYDYALTDFAFSEPGMYHMAFIGLLSTEYESIAQDSNNSIYYLDLLIHAKEFRVARIFQMRERTADPSQYKNTEKIGLVLELQDEELRNLKNEINVVGHFALCSAQTGENCTYQTKTIYPNSFLYDERGGYNYYFFNQYLTKDDGSLLPDGNYLRFYASITLVESDYNYYYSPVLIKKCKNANYSLTDFFFNPLGTALDIASNLAVGCTAGNFPEKIVSFELNLDQEDRIQIKNSYSPTAPTQEFFGCINADQNNYYVNSFKQRLLCAVVATMGEQQIDKMRLTITNNNSDLSATQYKQYIDLEIPVEYLIYQQPALLKQFLEINRHTQPLTTVGDVVAEGFNWIGTGFLNNTVSVIDATHLKDFMVNVGYDANFSKLFSPTNVNIILFYQVDGLKVVNVKDYFSDNTVRNPTNFLRYAYENNLYLPKDDETIITVYGSEMQPLFKTQQNSYLVINEVPTKGTIKRQPTDINADDPSFINPVYESAPNILQFNIISDLFYNNTMDNIRRYVPITLKTIIKKKFNITDFGDAIAAIIDDPVGSLTDFLFSNILIITIILMLMVIGAYITIMFRGRG